MEAIVLAGGLGTRLSHIVSDVPKPMAPVQGYPFLKYIFDYLLRNGVNHIILAVGYKSDIVYKYFTDNYQGASILYSTETIPLGTGGAIKKALDLCKEENVFIFNGDTYFDVDLKKFCDFHNRRNSKLSIAVKHMKNFERYGSVVIINDVVKKFKEKKPTLEGKINGGVYFMNREIMNLIDKESFSFENEVLESGLIDIYAFESKGYFIDIGIPEDYCRVQKEFENKK